MSSPTVIPDTARAALLAAAQAEQVAAFGYGTLGPKLTAGAHPDLGRSCEQAHRDLAVTALGFAAAASGTPTGPGNYQLPSTASDDASAQQLAIRLEESCASAWRYVLAQLAGDPAASGPVWTAAVAALTDSSVRAVRWRKITNIATASVAFPGI